MPDGPVTAVNPLVQISFKSNSKLTLSQRVKQVESLLQRKIAEVLQRGLADPRVKGLISVTRVEVTQDLRQAKVFVSVFPQDFERLTLMGLQASTRHIQSELRPRLALRHVPHLAIDLDTKLRRQQEVFDEIAEGLRRTAAREGAVDEAGQGADADVASATDSPVEPSDQPVSDAAPPLRTDGSDTP